MLAGVAMSINGVNVLKKIICLILGFILVLPLSACEEKQGDPNFRDDAAYDKNEGFAVSLTLNYELLLKRYPQIKNDMFGFINAQNFMPEGREVKVIMDDFTNPSLHEGKTIILTSNGLEISDESLLYTDGRYFPLETVLAMTGKSTLNEMLLDIGQPRVYEELGDFCAFLIGNPNQTYTPSFSIGFGDKSDVVYYGTPEQAYIAEFRYEEEAWFRSLQITEDSIYCFMLPYNEVEHSIIVYQIPRNSSEGFTKQIFYSVIGLPEIFTMKFIENMFVDGDYLFFLGHFLTSIEPLNSDFYVLAYNLKTDEFDVYKTFDVDYVGKLFRYKNGLGFVTSMYDEQGYLTKTGVRFLDFDEVGCELSFKEDLFLPRSDKWAYDMGIVNELFYCIDNKLCGIMTIKGNSASLVYVEFDLDSNGAVTTCVPFAKFNKEEYKNLVYNNFAIRDNGKGVSEHNLI